MRIALRIAALVLLLTVVIPTVAQGSNSSGLETDYAGKVRIFKSFYCGNSLDFDADGKLLSKPATGPWTKCGYIKIKHVKQKRDDGIEIDGQRIVVVFKDQKPNLMTTDRIRIQISGVDKRSEEAAKQSIERLFIDSKGTMADYVPEYWKPYVLDPARFAKERDELESKKLQCFGEGSAVSPCRVGDDIAAPTARSTPDPDYDSDAKEDRMQGTTILKAVVSPTGEIARIFVARPLGFGLDEKAIQAVSKWKFSPATRKSNGAPVYVQLTVEVNFHLY